MRYNLTDKQKDLLRWMAQEVKAGRLAEEFHVAWTNSGAAIAGYKGNLPELTRGMLNALESSGLLLAERKTTRMGSDTWETDRHITLCGEAYAAVDSDFAAPDKSFAQFMPPAVELSYVDPELQQRCIPVLGAGGTNPMVWDAVIRTAQVVLEDRLRSRGSISDRGLFGRELVNAVFGKAGTLAPKFTDPAERQGYRDLYAGVVGVFRNDYGHHLVDPAPEDGACVLGLINLLLKMLEKCAK